MDNSTKMMGLYVIISLIIFCLCVGTWLAFNNSKKSQATPTPAVKAPVAQPVKPAPAVSQPKAQVTAQPARTSAPTVKPPTPKPGWTPMPGYGGIIRYRVEPLQ